MFADQNKENKLLIKLFTLRDLNYYDDDDYYNFCSYYTSFIVGCNLSVF